MPGLLQGERSLQRLYLHFANTDRLLWVRCMQRAHWTCVSMQAFLAELIIPLRNTPHPVAQWFNIPDSREAGSQRGPPLTSGARTTISRAEGVVSDLSILDTNKSLEFIQVCQSHLTDKKTEVQKSGFAQGHTAW